MGYPDDETLAEAHGWNTDRPSISEVLANSRIIDEPKPKNKVLDEVMKELARATVKFPTWPIDPLHALGIIHEEVGELSKGVLQLVYEPHKSNRDEVRKEAIQAAAMALRFAMNLDAYVYRPGPQHSQNPLT